MDVICVIDENNQIHNTHFHVKLRSPVLDQTALALLGYEDYIRYPSDCVASEVTQHLKDITKISAQTYKTPRSSPLPSRDVNFPGIGTESSSKSTSSTYTEVKHSPQETDLVVITCNAVEVQDVVAFVASDSYVRFYDPESQTIGRTPSSRILAKFGLVRGRNSVICTHSNTGVYRNFDIWLYSNNDKLVVIDIDGTITKSDITGYIQTVYMGVFSYIHNGVVPFLNILQETYRYRIVYLTSRPFAHLKETKQFLQGIKDDHGLVMPPGPLFPSKDRVMAALYREMISKSTVQLKAGIMSEIIAVFSNAGSKRISPFVLGIGNKENDALAYNLAGMNAERILIIDKMSQITVWKYQRNNTGTSNTSKHSNDRGSRKQRDEYSLDSEQDRKGINNDKHIITAGIDRNSATNRVPIGKYSNNDSGKDVSTHDMRSEYPIAGWNNSIADQDTYRASDGEVLDHSHVAEDSRMRSISISAATNSKSAQKGHGGVTKGLRKFLKRSGSEGKHAKGIQETTASTDIVDQYGLDVSTLKASANYTPQNDTSDPARYTFDSYKDFRLLQYIDKLAGMNSF